MPSAVEATLAQFRAQLAQREAASVAAMMAAYEPVRDRLRKQIDQMATTLAERPLTVGELARDRRARDLLRQIEAELTALGVGAQAPIVAAQADAVARAGEDTQTLALSAAVGSATATARVLSQWNRVNTAAVESLVGRLQDGSPLTAWLADLGTRTASKVERALIDAVARGLGPREAARQLAKQVDTGLVRLLATTRTAQMNAYRDATLQSMAANADILSGWRWTAALSDRTCLGCLGLSGRVFPLTETFMAAHVCCRCIALPLVKDGPPLAIPTGADWFTAQPEMTRRSMVPVRLWDAVEAGRVQIEDFVQFVPDDRWGGAYLEASVTRARANAARRRRSWERIAA